jgi:hypothetical protein
MEAMRLARLVFDWGGFSMKFTSIFEALDRLSDSVSLPPSLLKTGKVEYPAAVVKNRVVHLSKKT